MSVKISIIIPNWNGKAFLNRCIGAILHSAVEYGRQFECIVMDDASTDGSGDEALRQFPDIQLVSHDVNRGFGAMVNEGARLAEGEVLVLINNDLIARADFITNLCKHFDNRPELFGVSGKTVDWENNTPNHVNMRGHLEQGRLKLTWSDDSSLTETMFLQGGSCAIRRAHFLEFGGFHHLYAPGYWEDYDISYQALKAGLVNLYEPGAVGSHLGQGSMIRAHGRERIEFVRERNRFLLLALNLTDEKLHREFWASLPEYVRRGNGIRFKQRLAIFLYLARNAAIIKAERKARVNRQRISDAELFQKFAGLGQPC